MEILRKILARLYGDATGLRGRPFGQTFKVSIDNAGCFQLPTVIFENRNVIFDHLHWAFVFIALVLPCIPSQRVYPKILLLKSRVGNESSDAFWLSFCWLTSYGIIVDDYIVVIIPILQF